MAEKGESFIIRIGKYVFGISLIFGTGLAFIASIFITIILWLMGFHFLAIGLFLNIIGMFGIMFIGLGLKHRSFIPIGFILIFVGITLASFHLLFENRIWLKVLGVLGMIFGMIFLGILIVATTFEVVNKKSKNVDEKEKLNQCGACDGTGKTLGIKICQSCMGSGIYNPKLDERPILCFYCANTGKCHRCFGTKFQKKYRIFGSKIECKKCNGTGICSICRDAPNGGYFITFHFNDMAGSQFGEEGRRLFKTDKEIKRLHKIWEELKLKQNEILSFEDFAKYPSYNKIQELEKKSENPWLPLIDIVDAELERYEQYLEKFK